MGQPVATEPHRAATAPACDHCGLRTAGGEFCCYGCELAARIAAEGAVQSTRLKSTLTFSLLLSMAVMMLSLFLFAEDVYGADAAAGMLWMRQAYRVAAAVLATPVVLLLAPPLVRRAAGALRDGRPSMDLLIGAGALAAYGVSLVSVVRGAGGVYFDSATSALLLATLGRYLEATARAKASGLLAPTLARAAQPVTRVVGEERAQVSPAEVRAGDELEIEVEQALPVDARVTGGAVDVNLGVLTGAALPVSLAPGAEAPAGAVPVSGALRCVALRPASESTLERLSALADALRSRPSRLLRAADGFAAALTPVVLALAAATFALWVWRASVEKGTITALAVVLAACPCTYGVATPLVLWLSLRKALEHGVCVRSAAALEELAAVRTVAFDKTGTLTSEELAVLEMRLAPGVDRADALSLVAALEAGSGHPIARALVALAEREGIPPAVLEARRLEIGSGVTGRDADGRDLALGSARLLAAVDVALPDDDDAGAARVALARGGRTIATFRIGEEERPEAKEAVAALSADGLRSVMLTGDNRAGAATVAASLGLEAHADLGPADKLAHLAGLGAAVAMVGDGLNDAPALAGAGPSFAMGGGAGLARGMSQVTLLKADLRLVPWTLALARKATAIARTNLWASTIYNLVFLGLAVGGALRPVWAGVSMLTSSLLVLASSARISAIPGPLGAAQTAAVAPGLTEAAGATAPVLVEAAR